MGSECRVHVQHLSNDFIKKCIRAEKDRESKMAGTIDLQRIEKRWRKSQKGIWVVDIVGVIGSSPTNPTKKNRSFMDLFFLDFGTVGPNL